MHVFHVYAHNKDIVLLYVCIVCCVCIYYVYFSAGERLCRVSLSLSTLPVILNPVQGVYPYHSQGTYAKILELPKYPC